MSDDPNKQAQRIERSASHSDVTEIPSAMFTEVFDSATKIAVKTSTTFGEDLAQFNKKLESVGHLPVMQFMGAEAAARAATDKPEKPEQEVKAAIDKDFFGRVSGVHTATFDRTIKYDVFGDLSEVTTVDRETGKRETFQARWNGLGSRDTYSKLDPQTGKRIAEYDYLKVDRNDGTISYGKEKWYGMGGEDNKQFHDGRKVTKDSSGNTECWADGTSVHTDNNHRVVSSTVLREGKLVQVDYKYDERGVSEIKYSNTDGTGGVKEIWRKEATGWVKYDSTGTPLEGRNISGVHVEKDGRISYSDDKTYVVEHRNGSTRLTPFSTVIADPQPQPEHPTAGKKQVQKRAQK